jgi:hypothetical protein
MTDKKRQNAAEPETLSYLVQRERTADIIIQVKADWKLTFGAVNPGNGEGGRYGNLHCLRVWEGEKLRAVFCDVRGFRDLSIPLAAKVEKETGAATWTQDSNGNFERNESRQIETAFEVLADDRDDEHPF